ncbi:snRNA-activating protein complex subunit 1-like [Phymastichus coffea]|uniref:snRNA-activating protein complex subunit 1-like n=1 Tax=Phymastichus coffea TaxID=108790 RepID=UPI00273A78B7|nr:snRNA-activating protein complex subunit 1-like [Phymastichus coffea]XP_058800494.1 snRNA-activating protein complex subunit 1-like [Phymastichus coffea]
MAAVDITNVACGFYEDCIKLFEIFKSHESIRFEDFVAAWQEIKFSLIFLCRKNYAELIEFCEESLQIAKSFVLTSNDFIDRVAGLYLLYGLYNKIPIEDIKIRVTLKEWEFFLEFFEQLKYEKLHDASYIFAKLVTDNAFYHCLFTTEYGLEKSFKTRQEYSFSFDNPYSVLPVLVDEVEKRDLGKILKFSEIYHEQKKKVLGSSSKNKLQLFDKNFMDEIVNNIEQLQEKRQNFPALRKKVSKVSLHLKTEKPKYPDNKVRSKLGHGFDTDEDSDDEEMSMNQTFEQPNRNLPNFNDDLEDFDVQENDTPVESTLIDIDNNESL